VQLRYSDWNDGRAVCALVDALRPGFIPVGAHKLFTHGSLVKRPPYCSQLAHRVTLKQRCCPCLVKSSSVISCVLVQNHRSLDPNDKLNNATLGIDTAEAKMGVDKLIFPNEMIHPKVDKLAMMTYIAQYRNLPDNCTYPPICAHACALVALSAGLVCLPLASP